MINRYSVFVFMLLTFLPSVSAQNVTGYDAMEDPLLFLLREPAVQQDLGLTVVQKQGLVELNESLDGILLSSRNKKNSAEVQQQTREVFQQTQEAIAKRFSFQQQDRLRQIAYRLKGMSFVLLPDAAKELELTSEQKEKLQATVTDTQEQLNKFQSREYQGEKAHREAQQTVAAARKQEQAEILAALNESQRRKLVALVGKPFDPAQLGRVSFKAPDLVDSGEWINSQTLALSDLRGKVVALHFFAFG